MLEATPYGPAEAFPLLAHGAQAGDGDVTFGTMTTRNGPPLDIAETPFVLVSVAVHNGSDELIGPIWVKAFDRDDGQTWNFSVPLGFVEPHNYGVVELYCSYGGGDVPRILPRVVFRDSGNRWWRRSGWDGVERRPSPTAWWMNRLNEK
ncbi:hypothetical protein ASD18_16245 [Cellulomonas sp. Root137]|nr:hypothetical protein ASD18_16245 [Cellulomonas sp. Root137]